jgi:hypothetical protein
MQLLTYSSSKIEKSNNAGGGYLTAIMYLAPYKLSGHNVCSNASPGCIQGCLNLAGRGKFDNVQNARIKRTQWFYSDRKEFMTQLFKEIAAHVRKAHKLGLKPAVRLNGTSDLPWEKISHAGNNPMHTFPEVTFYDYTKIVKRLSSNYQLPPNYSLTFSRSEKSSNYSPAADVGYALENGKNVAVVFHHVPEHYHGIRVIDGDKHDMRFLDPVGVIVGLKAKGKAKKDTTGFVV